ncbi:MAG: acyl-CoA ligase (AMP-forming), exosortase A system-associated [Alteromonadaceae bacterium]|nr:acyl-CoA ligase (AMP-forming), exosortase A system-associated [Alteromonadaceae bacterium]
MPIKFHELITQSAQKTPDATALVLKDTKLSYNELNTQIQKIAKSYHQLNVNFCDRIGIYLPKTIENVTCMFASSIIGAVFVPINPFLKTNQVQHIVNDCKIKLLITNKGRLSSLLSSLSSFSSITHIIVVDGNISDDMIFQQIKLISWQSFINNSEPERPVNTSGINELAAILYTSGSTGSPKGVMISHENFIVGAKSVASYLNSTSSDRILAVLPLSFDYGLNQLTTTFLVGASCILLDYLLPKDVIKAIVKYKITGLAAVPPLWAQLCKKQWPESSGNGIRYFTNSGGVLQNSTLNELRALMPNAKPYMMYGLTEAFRSTYLPPEYIDSKTGSIGKAIPNSEILVLRNDGSECDTNEPGELVHTGPLVTLGYWNNSAKTKKRFKPLRNKKDNQHNNELAVWSGDTVRKDKDGFLYFISREDEMIKTSGYRVSPTEIESILHKHQDVIDAVVIGNPHTELGEIIIAIVLVDPHLSSSHQLKASVLQLCKQNLANFMIPKKIICLEQFPLNANGKINRNKLKQSYLEVFIN